MASKSSDYSFSKLEIKLINAGKMVLNLPSSNDEIVSVLQRTEKILYLVQQTPSTPIKKAMQPIITALIAKGLVKHLDMNVNISVASCICEIMRIMAPDIPYKKQEMTDFFEMVVITFENLSSVNGGCYTKMAKVLKIFSHNRLSVLMLDFELDGHGLILRLFKQFLTVADSNSSAIVHKMEKIITMIIEESEELAPQLIRFLVTSVKNDNQINSPVSLQLVEKVLMNRAAKLIPHLPVMRRDMSIALYDYAKMVGRIHETSPENDFKEFKKPIPHATEINKSREDTTQKIKAECVETVRHCQQRIHSEDRNNYEKRFDDLPISCKSVIDLKGKRKRNDTSLKKKVQSVKLGENLVGSRIKVWWPYDGMYYEGVVKSFDCKQKMHKLLYEDGKEEPVDLKLEQWEFVRNVSSYSNYALEHGENLVGKRIKVWWPFYKTYYEGVVEFFDSTERKHKISYDDGDEELTCLEGRRWKLIENTCATSKSAPEHGENLVGKRIKVWWPSDNTYYDGVVESFDFTEMKHKISYDDGDEELTCLEGRRWKLIENTSSDSISNDDGDEEFTCLKGRRWDLIENESSMSDFPRQLVLALPSKDSSQCAKTFRQWNIAASRRELVTALPKNGSSQSGVMSYQRNITAERDFETASPRKLVLALPKKVSSSHAGITCVQGYNVKKSTEPILKTIFKKHGDITAECVLKTASAKSSFLEIICEIARRIQTNDVDDKLEEIESQVSDAEAVKINVSWLRAHLQDIHKRKEAMKKSTFHTEMKSNGCISKVIDGKNVVERT